MRELSLNILDICKNSTKAKATEVVIKLVANQQEDEFSIEITDDGVGIAEDFLATISDPFTTTRTTRKVGMGLPLFKMSAEQAGGEFSISSKLGEGTCVRSTYKISSVDRMPLGDIGATMQLLISADPQINFCLQVENGKESYSFSVAEVVEIVGREALCSQEVQSYIYELLKENTQEILGGKI